MKLKHKKNILKAVVIIFILMFIIVNIVGIYIGNIFYNKVCKISMDRTQDAYETFKKSFNYGRLNVLDQEDVSIKSNFGYKLSGTYIKNPSETQNTVIILHGITGSRWEAMKYADMYIDLGFNILIYDSRYHGNSGGNDISLGYFEKYDLNNCVQWVRQKNPKGIIGVHGESMGAATALLQSKINEDKKTVSFYVVDCPYSDLTELFTIKLREELKPHMDFVIRGIIFYSSMVALYKSGFSIYSISPVKAVKDVKTPIMFIHGADDEFIPPTMTMELYFAKKAPKSIYIAQNAGHAMAYLTNKQEYSSKVRQFLKDNKIIDKNKVPSDLANNN